MSAELCFGFMKDYPPSLAASKKAGKLPENFAWYCFEWVGDIQTTDTMKLEGGVFRVAKSGPNKGKRSVLEKEGRRVVYINRREIEAAARKLKKAEAKTSELATV